MCFPDGHRLYTASCRIQAKWPPGRRTPLYNWVPWRDFQKRPFLSQRYGYDNFLSWQRWLKNGLLMELNCISRITILFAEILHPNRCQGKFCWKKKRLENDWKMKIFHYITSLILNWEYFHFDQMGPFRIGGSIKAMFLLVGLLLDVFERLRIGWHKIGPDLRESLRSKYQIWLIQRQFLVIILSVLPKT